MNFAFVTLDVFTRQKFTGNQLAIVLVPVATRSLLTEEQRQKIATEFNYFETVFLHEVGQDDEVADYDIFTVHARIPFAGHPTIGAAIYVSHYAQDRYPQVKTLHALASHIPLSYDAANSIASVAIPHVAHDVRIHRKRLVHPLSSANPNGEPTVPLVSIVKGITSSSCM
ncbi:Diaminopimelate epimerase-like protein [Dichomitus squalens LYAD-421 SS1]|uniref:Diaminopimelate epimerase-like protein n=1 Tax=Dichomitus squalens (strain LYAD-421) TaxID=732165 RepID=UPI00044124B9|nr:Diaminopimelate epimerase-like protein [Dichomitus squalens LYAD-421 SS1]EJF66740.1 Diaminopimelate epimerase-like protein [Dichomitus squalens LYAD-421 SS1]